MTSTSTRSAARERATAGGLVLFLLGVSFFASALKELRPTVAGLSVHPYVFVLLLGLVVFVSQRGLKAHGLFGGAGVALIAAIAISELVNGTLVAALPSLVKWATIALTLIVTSNLVANGRDFRLGAVGMILGVSLIAARGLVVYQSQPSYYLNVMDGIGSRNVFSLWTLAPVAYCVWFLMAKRQTGLREKLFALGSLLLMAVPQVLSLSRAGWIMLVATVVLVAAMKRSARFVPVALVLGLSVQWAVDEYGFGARLQDRFEELQTGTGSDAKRTKIIEAAPEILLDNPLFGVSQTRLPLELARRLYLSRPIASHNFLVEMAAGTGVVGLLALIACAVALFRQWERGRRARNDDTREFAGLIVVLMALIVLRGMTANEVIYNPSIAMGLGLVVGLLRAGRTDETAPVAATRATSWRLARA